MLGILPYTRRNRIRVVQRLGRRSIQSFEDLQERFLTCLTASRVQRKEKFYLISIGQKRNESLYCYLNRFIEV